jgi:predicted PolB exonuclease-like 3'-5' exonuclease
MKFALDIETVPNASLIDSLPEPEVKTGNLKDPELVAKKTAEAKTRQIETMALSPFTGRVCSWAVCGECPRHWNTAEEISDAEEIRILTPLFEMLATKCNQHSVVVTWNGNVFDLPFIYTRAALLNVELPPGCPRMSYWTKRYYYAPHCDIAQWLAGWQQHAYISLDRAAGMILGERKLPMDVKEFPVMIREGRSTEIGLYNLHDAELTWNIYSRMANYLF